MKIGLALSGGGIRGIAHAGVLKALEENNIKIDVIGGTSSGSIVAGLYSMGYSPYYIYILFKRYAKELINQNPTSIISGIGGFMTNKRTHFSGFYTGEEIEDIIKDFALKKGIKKVSDIKMPLIIPAVDVQNSKEYIFTNLIPEKIEDKSKYITEIPIGKAIRASSSFPIVFSPCEYENHKFLDGGILDNIPSLEVKNFGAEKIISVNFEADNIDENSSVMDIVMRAVDIMGNKVSEESLCNSDIVLTIKTDKTGLLEFENIDDCYKYGYRQTIKNIDKIKDMINN